jgi:hypothetical protein
MPSSSILLLSSILPYTALDFFDVPFWVPLDTQEIQIDHKCDDPSITTNILDWGLRDCNNRVLGWGGGNIESIIINTNATSRSYLSYYNYDSPLPTNCTWNVIVGKPRIATPPGSYSINVTFRDVPTLSPQLERSDYIPCLPLDIPSTLKFYAGDFHVHSRESGDAFVSASVDEIATFSHSVGLDFVHISDHNTVSVSTFVNDAQVRHPNLLILPGVEYTTYSGHAGALFTTKYVDHRIGLPGVSIDKAVDAIHAQGGLVSINHLDNYENDGTLRNKCVGCAWDFGGSLSYTKLDAIEVAIQSWNGIGFIYTPRALEFWDRLHALGFTNVAPIGGSDDHHGGMNETVIGPWIEGSQIGSPTTMVLAANLSQAGIYEGIKLGRIVLKFNNRTSDPDIDFIATLIDGDIVRVGGTVVSETDAMITLTATVSAVVLSKQASHLRGKERSDRQGKIKSHLLSSSTDYYIVLVRNNEQTFIMNVSQTLPFTFSVNVTVPIAGTDRWRAELHDNTQLCVMTNHIFLPALVDTEKKETTTEL